jgi:hypothetical protein
MSELASARGIVEAGNILEAPSFLRPTSQDGRLAPAQRPARYRPGGPRQ